MPDYLNEETEQEYGVTEEGFVIKRLDTILEEVHSELTEGFGVDTRLSPSSFLNVLVTSFCGQIANLWETAQDSYYAKYPATATGINLDNAVQYGGIRREGAQKTVYPLHCTGEDGTTIREEAVVATDTSPEIRLYSVDNFSISRDSFNEVSVKISSEKENELYVVSINGNQYSYQSTEGNAQEILEGLKNAITDEEYVTEINSEDETLIIRDSVRSRTNKMELSSNLTTSKVTVIANFATEEYGKITIPDNVVKKIINNISGFDEVTNVLEPVYGRDRETDIELRQSYLAKSAIRSDTMIDSIVGELLNNVDGVETASGYENVEDTTDSRGLPPHSIEIVVEGGDDNEIAQAILRRKAGGIQTYGSKKVEVPGIYGDPIMICFNRPEYIYVWIRVDLYGDDSIIPINYKSLTADALLEKAADLFAGDSFLVDLFKPGIYEKVSGITKINIYTANSTDSSYVPKDEDYSLSNIIATSRQKVLVSESRINTVFYGSEA